jgi:hypothetical protein
MEEDAPASAEEDPCAKVKTNLFTCYCKVDLHADCMIAHRKSSSDRPSKVAEQAISSVATASAPPPVGGTSLTIYSNAEAKHSTWRVLHYLESLKDVETERRYPIFIRCFKHLIFFTDFMISTCSLNCRTGDDEESAV